MLDAGRRFGRQIITADGALDRAQLAALAFDDPDAVKDLNDIVHPAVRAEIARRVAANAGTDNVVVLDIPLITERDTYAMAALVVVDVPTEIAVERLVAARAMTEDQVRLEDGRPAPRSGASSWRTG